MATTKTTTTKTPEERKAYWKEKVPVKLPLNHGNPDDQTQFASVGDYRVQIQRGVEVMVPRNIAKVLERSEQAEYEAFLNRSQMAKQYEQDAARLN